MRIILLATLFFVITECKITKVSKEKNDLEYWKPDGNFNKSSALSNKKNRTLNNKPVLRHNLYKLNEATKKWPKEQRKFSTKLAARITKFDKMQDEDTTGINLHESDEYSDDEYISAYSVQQQLQKVVQKIPDVNVTVTNIGRTISYLDIILLKMTKDKDRYYRADNEKYMDEKPEKKIIFIVHGLSVMGVRLLPWMTTTSAFLSLVSYYVEYLDNFDIFLIPMANPDGYATSKPGFIWNKNITPQNECEGVALDRNFDIAWNNNYTISSCSQEYPGATAFSEPESRAIRDILNKYNHKIVAYLNVHAGTYGFGTFKGDAVLYPHGYTDSVSDEDKFIDLKAEIDEAIRNASFQVYSVTVDSLYNWYGRVSGSSVDYASTVYGVPFALELVMQPYDDEGIPEDYVTFSESALTQVWSRVIDVIFKFVLKSLEKDNETR